MDKQRQGPFACVGRGVRCEAVHTGLPEKPDEGEGEKEVENLNENAKEEVAEVLDEMTFKHSLEVMLEDSSTIYTNPASASSYESDRIDNTSSVPVGEVSSILEEQCFEGMSW